LTAALRSHMLGPGKNEEALGDGHVSNLGHSPGVELGELQGLGALQDESVWNRFGVMAQAYWLVCEPSLMKRRQERAHPGDVGGVRGPHITEGLQRSKRS
jgi:hypothetical protein